MRSLLLAIFVACPAHAISFPFTVRTFLPTLSRRADISGQSTRNISIPVSNTHNAEYIANITIAGKTVPVLLDTGSSDLWVAGSGYQATDTGKSATLSYAVGKASGDIFTGRLEFDNYTVEDQAFLLVNDTSSFSMDIGAQGFQGLVGLGPNTGSIIRKKLGDGAGDGMLFRIFSQNRTSQNFISFLLDRQADPGNAISGQLTVSETVPGFENITAMPKLSVELVEGLVDENQHWQILADKNAGIIGPDGQIIQIKSIVPKAPRGQLVAVIDSGFTLPQVPRDVSDAIYGRVQGAVYDTQGQYWTVPCGQYLNISFNFGGVNYPIHPLDTVNNDFAYKDRNGNSACIGAFQPITSAFSLLGNYDMILGMAFLRNTYTLLDFGNWVGSSSNDHGDPYVQLLPLTNVNAAKADFIANRLNGVDTTGSAQFTLLPADQMQHSPVSDAEKKAKYQEMILSRWPYIFLGCAVFLVLLIGCCIWRCCCRRRRQRQQKAKTQAGPYQHKGDETAYYPLESRETLHGKGYAYNA